MVTGDERPPGVELRQTGQLVIARHEPTGISANGSTAAEAIEWLAEGVALQLGADMPVDDPEAFLTEFAEEQG